MWQTVDNRLVLVIDGVTISDSTAQQHAADIAKALPNCPDYATQKWWANILYKVDVKAWESYIYA